MIVSTTCTPSFVITPESPLYRTISTAPATPQPIRTERLHTLASFCAFQIDVPLIIPRTTKPNSANAPLSFGRGHCGNESWSWPLCAASRVGNGDHRSLGHPGLQQGLYLLRRAADLTLRMKIARFHRLTLAFSRKLANLKAAVALYFWSYNFCLILRSLRMTPAMAAGITDRIWELGELI